MAVLLRDIIANGLCVVNVKRSESESESESQTTKDTYYAHMATIVDIKDNADTVYKTGKRCAVLSIDDPDDYTSIVFIECDDSRKVNKLHVSTDPRYIFNLDE